MRNKFPNWRHFVVGWGLFFLKENITFQMLSLKIYIHNTIKYYNCQYNNTDSILEARVQNRNFW